MRRRGHERISSTRPSSAAHGEAIIAQLKEAGVGVIVSVPDIVTRTGFMANSKDPDFQLIAYVRKMKACPFVPPSYTDPCFIVDAADRINGLLNAIRAIAMDYHQPVCMMVGLQGKAPDETVLGSASYGVRIIPPILDAMALRMLASKPTPTHPALDLR